MKRNLNLFLISAENSIKESMVKIKKNGTRTLLVVKKNKFLLGTISEGDIHSALIKNFDINSSIKKIFNKNPKKITLENYNLSKLNKMFLDKQIGLIPVVDNNNFVKKIISWQDIFGLKNNSLELKKLEVVIMAGGRGERLKPYTSVLPKPLIPINNKPMLEHIISNFKFFNIQNFHLVLNHQANLIKSYFNNHDQKFKINYVIEPKPLGTVGGVRLLKKISSKNFLLSNCDTLFKIDYLKFYNHHIKNKNYLTLVVSKVQHEFSYGSCKVLQKKLISINEKPKLNFIANAGLYVMKKEIINLIPSNKKFDLTDLINKCIKLNKKIGVFDVPSNAWTDLGQLSDFNKAFKNIN
jgi:dTDP-glucose pyrophosphorylase